MSALYPFVKLVMAVYIKAGGRLQLDVKNVSLSPRSISISTYRGGAYCGPGWGFTIEEIKGKGIASMPGTIDAIEAACKMHDACYARAGYFSEPCDQELVANMLRIVKDPKSPRHLQVDAAVMAAVFQFEALVSDPVFKRYQELESSFARMFHSNVSMEYIIEWHRSQEQGTSR
jgi:hypothetical protein